MALPNWWQETKPHKDIREGKFYKDIFAADLGEVVYGRAQPDYKDPCLFFDRTYLTKGLKTILENVLSRLSGGKGDPVIQIQTPFGGGKTHALLALYHAVKNREQVKHLNIFSKLPEPKNARVVVFVGTHGDPLSGRTPWGEIAHQLGAYEKVKEHDKRRLSPGKELLYEILGEDPVLILIDELVEYAVKAKDFGDQISAFSQEITEVVKSKNNCCLVCTLPSSAPYGETGERVLRELQMIYGRVEAIYTPVEGVEIYELIRKRLFEEIGDVKIRKEVAKSYFDMYKKLGLDVPQETNEIEYRERIEHAYPFHPELIEVLYHRWGSYSTFQRTRGVLRLLAEVVADLYKRKVPSPLIQSSLVNLENEAIRQEFLKYIGREYESVISADIAGISANASKIDKEMGSEYEKYGIASSIATAVFLYSFSGAERKGTNLQRIRVALLREGIPPTIVGDAISKLEHRLWYFHSENQEYAFRNQPNLNRVIIDKEEKISEETINEKLKEKIQKIAGKKLEVYIWPESASDIPDNKILKLAILAPEYSHGSEKGNKLVSELFERAGESFRVYKNTLFIIAMDRGDSLNVSNSIKRLLALKEITESKDLYKTLSRESLEELKKKLEEAEKDVPYKILTAYRHLAMLEREGVVWSDLGILSGTDRETNNISERVYLYLKAQEKILSHITPKYIVDKSLAEKDDEKNLYDIYELSLKTPGMPLLADEKVLVDAVREGVKSGILAVRESSEIYYKEEVSPTMYSTLIRGEVAEKIKEKMGEKLEEKVSEPERQGEIKKRDSEAVKRISLRAKIPWDKLKDVITGVIGPLIDKSPIDKPPEVTIEIRAEAENEFDRQTLDMKVKETLKQITAKIEEWKEE